MRFPFEFISPAEVTIEEASKGVAMIRGTLLAEGESRNRNLYTIAEMKRIVETAIGLPIYFGVMIKRDPNTGMMMKNMHANTLENKIGEIIHSWFDKVKRKIKFIAEVANTVKYPNIIESIKKGWGISIGGIATRAKRVINEAGRVLTKILGLKLNHIQLLPPEVIRGQRAAKVEGVKVEETMIIYCDPVTGVCILPSKVEAKQEYKISEISISVSLDA